MRVVQLPETIGVHVLGRPEIDFDAIRKELTRQARRSPRRETRTRMPGKDERLPHGFLGPVPSVVMRALASVARGESG